VSTGRDLLDFWRAVERLGAEINRRIGVVLDIQPEIHHANAISVVIRFCRSLLQADEH
jgi:hypothetical protein